MSSSNSLELIKKWTPKAAILTVVLFSLVIFWLATSFVMQFLATKSFSPVEDGEKVNPTNSVKEKNEKTVEFLQRRAEKRQATGTPQTFGEEEKDPFNLP